MPDFDAAFTFLTGNAPFPWQRALYHEWFTADRTDNIPASCNLPTGLGKTSVIAIWLIALAYHQKKIPRRLVYVVNRRTVVDQTTDEVVKLRERLQAADANDAVKSIRALLETMCALPLEPKDAPLAISTLRGQFADNREWSADPCRPAVICGTVDMIGSRLLFSGYGVGFKGKPLHAGFLGQDALLVHDEAHLEPAFQELLIAIRDEQHCKERTELPWPKLRLMELSATSRGSGAAAPEKRDIFQLTPAEENAPNSIPNPPEEPIHHVWMRLTAKKGLKLHPTERDDVATQVARLALGWKSSEKAILLFVRTIEDVKSVRQVLTDSKTGVKADQVQILTGTLRGLERDDLATKDPVFARFVPSPKTAPKDGTVCLICTSAGEVGVDMSADHLSCDLTTFDSMAQRLGRINRRGGGTAEVDVVFETDPDPKKKDDDFEKARWNTKLLLERLRKCDWNADRHDASPLGLRALELTDDERKGAFAPEPLILPATDILFDSWALTTVRGPLPGRPPVEPYLHGVNKLEPPQTLVAWREEVAELPCPMEVKRQKAEFERFAADLLEDYPLKPHELLKEPSYRAFKNFEAIAKRSPDAFVWLVNDFGAVTVLTLTQLANKDKKEQIDGVTVLLPPQIGGLAQGMLDGASLFANDVSDQWFTDSNC